MNKLSLQRLCPLLAFVWLIIVLCLPVSFATEGDLLPIRDERKIPDDFDVAVSYTPTDHRFFEQAVAQPDGVFAICSRFTEESRDVFSRVYVDVYRSNGTFWKEVSFSTQFEVTIELMDNSLFFHFYDYVVVFDLATEHLACFEIEPNFLRNSGRYNELRRNRFTYGEWEYSCQKSVWGYTKLTRANGIQTQVLVSLRGIESTIVRSLVSLAVIGASILVVYTIIGEKRKRL